MEFRVKYTEPIPDFRDTSWVSERDIKCPSCLTEFEVPELAQVIMAESNFIPLEHGQVQSLRSGHREPRRVRLRCPVCEAYLEVWEQLRMSPDIFPFLTDRDRGWRVIRSLGPPPTKP